MSFAQGSPLPDITEKTNVTTPDWYTNLANALSTTTQGALGTTSVGPDGKPVYTAKTAAEGIAGLDPLQQQAYAGTTAAASAYQPGLSAAQNTANQAAQGINYDQIQAYMDPYRNNVVNEMGRLANQNYQRNVLPGMAGQFVGTGGLGGQRYANAMGQSAAEMQSNLTGQQYGALSKAYNDAVNAAKSQSELQNNAAITQGNLANAAQASGLKGNEAINAAGARQQAYEQSLLNFPLSNATNAANILRGYAVPQSQTWTGPKAGSYQMSPLQQILGIGGLLGAANSNSLLGQGVTNLFSGLNSYLSSRPIDWSRFTGGLGVDTGSTGTNVTNPDGTSVIEI
jgi:hypothetical protein